MQDHWCSHLTSAVSCDPCTDIIPKQLSLTATATSNQNIVQTHEAKRQQVLTIPDMLCYIEDGTKERQSATSVLQLPQSLGSTFGTEVAQYLWQ